MARTKRQEDPMLPVPLPTHRPSRVGLRRLTVAVKPELVEAVNSLAHDQDSTVSALLEQAVVELLRDRGIKVPDYLRHYLEKRPVGRPPKRRDEAQHNAA